MHGALGCARQPAAGRGARRRLSPACASQNEDVPSHSGAPPQPRPRAHALAPRRRSRCLLVSIFGSLHVAPDRCARFSRCAVVATLTRACSHSQDHVPTRKTERRRIRRNGGMIVNNRVQGRLAVSRAIGDLPYKVGRVGLFL